MSLRSEKLKFKNLTITLLIFGLQVNLLVAQNSNYSHELDSILGIDKLLAPKIDSVEINYKIVLDQANQFYKEQKYTEAVVFYRKALRIKPDERLPKYRIEDVYTLFLAHDIVETKEEAKELIAQVEMSLNTMNNEKLFIQKTEHPIKLEPIEIKKTEAVNIHFEEKQTVSPSMGIAVKPEEKKVIETPVEQKIVETPKTVVEEKPKQPEPVKIFEEPKPQPTPVKQAVAVEDFEENNKLLEKYTEKKTVEVITEPTKTVTNIYINTGNEVIIYSKVKHSWGGEFYFAKYPSLPKKNISLQHFMNSTGGVN